jgi:hypothetical protein
MAGLYVEQFVQQTTFCTTMANLGMTDVTFPKQARGLVYPRCS